MDFQGGCIHVRRSYWRGHENETKTGAESIVPLAGSVLALLESLGMGKPDPASAVLANSLGEPLDLHRLSKQVIRPVLEAQGLQWKGYYAGRRGSRTETSILFNGNSQILATMYRHSKEVADRFYIKQDLNGARQAAEHLSGVLRDNEGQSRMLPAASDGKQ